MKGNDKVLGVTPVYSNGQPAGDMPRANVSFNAQVPPRPSPNPPVGQTIPVGRKR